MYVNPLCLESICNALFNKIADEHVSRGLSQTEVLSVLQQLNAGLLPPDILEQKFQNNFFEFFHDLVFFSYGLDLDVTLAARGRAKFSNPPIPADQFVGKVDLFGLIKLIHDKENNKNYSKKYEGYQGFYRVGSLSRGRERIPVLAAFAEDCWKNIYNGYDQYQGTDGKEICLFNRARHLVGSYLHTAHPQIHYLHVDAESYPHPLATAILFESFGGPLEKAPNRNVHKLMEPYLIVEGVLANAGALKDYKEEIYHFLWKSIRHFANDRKQNIFVNTSHSQNQPEPGEFVDFVTKEEKIKRETKSTFTHYFEGRGSLSLEGIVIQGKKDLYYHDEQYADTFYQAHRNESPRKEHFLPFVPLHGQAQGIEIPLLQKRKKRLAIATGAMISITLIGGIYYETTHHSKKVLENCTYDKTEEICKVTESHCQRRDRETGYCYNETFYCRTYPVKLEGTGFVTTGEFIHQDNGKCPKSPNDNTAK